MTLGYLGLELDSSFHFLRCFVFKCTGNHLSQVDVVIYPLYDYQYPIYSYWCIIDIDTRYYFCLFCVHTSYFLCHSSSLWLNMRMSSANLRCVRCSPSMSIPLSLQSRLQTFSSTIVNNFGEIVSPFVTPLLIGI